jgi:hypothetical protein
MHDSYKYCAALPLDDQSDYLANFKYKNISWLCRCIHLSAPVFKQKDKIEIMEEDQTLEKLESKVRSLSDENSKLKKTNLWLGAFVVMVFLIELYNFVANHI